MKPSAIRCVVPSCLSVGEEFSLKIKLLGPVRKIECKGDFNTVKPALRGPFNLNVSRGIQYHDNCLPQWSGKLTVDGDAGLSGPKVLHFDGQHQGVFSGDMRPIRSFYGFSFDSPGFHFIRLIDQESGVEGVSNPIYVTEEKPSYRIFFGDPHWQTFFSDGLRCPEELYTFARDEAFLDFGAISDHMEAVTDRQWEYFQAVTNDFNQPGRFATLIGQEWTHHNKDFQAPGHRNIYYSGDSGPAVRSNDPDCNTLEKLWLKLDSISNQEVLAIPHHSANAMIGVDWKQGWNKKYEKAVEIHSIWGSSEKHKDDGNLMPIEHCNGEVRGQHVVDALKLGYKFGFIGGGDIHDGRPGDQLHTESYPPSSDRLWPAGYTAIFASSLSRANVFDAIKNRKTYATTESRIYFDVVHSAKQKDHRVEIKAASEDGIDEVAIVVNGCEVQKIYPEKDKRIVVVNDLAIPMEMEDFCYVRLTTSRNNMAWSSPQWNEDIC